MWSIWIGFLGVMDIRMQREEASAQEVFSYAQMSTLERNSGVGTLSRHLERERLERDSFTVDVRASDLQLDQPGPLHPCFSYRVWLYSIIIGVKALAQQIFTPVAKRFQTSLAKNEHLLNIYSLSGHPRCRAVCFFIRTGLDKCIIALFAHQWILCSKWVPS